jgi:hypothetical protein
LRKPASASRRLICCAALCRRNRRFLHEHSSIMDGCEIEMGRKSSVRCRAMLADCAYSTPQHAKITIGRGSQWRLLRHEYGSCQGPGLIRTNAIRSAT